MFLLMLKFCQLLEWLSSLFFPLPHSLHLIFHFFVIMAPYVGSESKTICWHVLVTMCSVQHVFENEADLDENIVDDDENNVDIDENVAYVDENDIYILLICSRYIAFFLFFKGHDPWHIFIIGFLPFWAQGRDILIPYCYTWGLIVFTCVNSFAYLWQVIIIGSITPLVTVPAMVTWGFELRPHRGYRNTHLIQFLPKLHIFRLWIYLRSSFMPHKDFAQLDCALLSKWRYTQQTRHGQKCTFTTASHTKYYVYFFFGLFLLLKY